MLAFKRNCKKERSNVLRFYVQHLRTLEIIKQILGTKINFVNAKVTIVAMLTQTVAHRPSTGSEQAQTKLTARFQNILKAFLFALFYFLPLL